MEFSKDQRIAIDSIVDWATSHTISLPAFTFSGAAGTGKTTVVSHLHGFLPMRKIVYCAYTGKASLVLRRKLTTLGISSDNVSTIHALMYDPIKGDDGEIVGWVKKESIDADLIIVDESSMVPKEIYDDLKSYGIPVLYVGDHFQLPPVSSDKFNLMDDPFIKLETPHRFAVDSTIVKVATRIRNGETLKYGVQGKGVVKRRLKTMTPKERYMFFQDDQLKRGDSIVLCGFNKTRVRLNASIRKHFGYPGLINNYERVICLKNYKRSNIPLYNGAIGTVTHVSNRFKKSFKAYVMMDGFDSNFIGNVYSDIFGVEKPNLFDDRSQQTQCFDYGYAISCHKSQGSSWGRVCVFEEECSLWDNHRWLYTAVTRAEKELLIVKN